MGFEKCLVSFWECEKRDREEMNGKGLVIVAVRRVVIYCSVTHLSGLCASINVPSNHLVLLFPIASRFSSSLCWNLQMF